MFLYLKAVETKSYKRPSLNDVVGADSKKVLPTI